MAHDFGFTDPMFPSVPLLRSTPMEARVFLSFRLSSANSDPGRVSWHVFLVLVSLAAPQLVFSFFFFYSSSSSIFISFPFHPLHLALSLRLSVCRHATRYPKRIDQRTV
jgi:hypothetical protein